MDAPEKYTLDEAHGKYARQTNGKVWNLLRQPHRSADENAEMIEAAYTSLYHWRFAGAKVNLQRGEWLIARVYTVLGQAESALRHAQRCLDLTNAHRDQMEDFDIAFAYEGRARALALSGKMDEAKKFMAQAHSGARKSPMLRTREFSTPVSTAAIGTGSNSQPTKKERVTCLACFFVCEQRTKL